MTPNATLCVFVITYCGVALGRLPGLIVDRTGIAMLGGMIMLTLGILSITEAVASLDAPTLILLYSMMVVSSQLAQGGFYAWCAARLVNTLDYPQRFLGLLMLTTAALSALFVNDIICLVFTPVLCFGLLRKGMNPSPFLIALAMSSNIGSAVTLIGNPQNMLIGQTAQLDFLHFTLWSLPPSLLALIFTYGLLLFHFRGKWLVLKKVELDTNSTRVEMDRAKTSKGLFALTLLLILFFTPLDRSLSALWITVFLLLSRRVETRPLLQGVDWHLISLFCALFVVIRGLELTGYPAELLAWMARGQWNLQSPGVLIAVSATLSNLVSNVPATMLLARFLSPDQKESWILLALSSTYAGNFILLGSLANLIVVEKAKPFGIKIKFFEHAQIGIPVTLVSLSILWLWWKLVNCCG